MTKSVNQKLAHTNKPKQETKETPQKPSVTWSKNFELSIERPITTIGFDWSVEKKFDQSIETSVATP